MSEVDDLALAEARAAAARERLNDTVGALQTQLAPQALMASATDGAKRGGRRVAAVAGDHKLAIAGIAAALVGLLARKPITRAASRLRDAVAQKRERTRKPAAQRRVRSDKPALPAPSRSDPKD